MAAVVRIKNNRFVKINLQYKDARYVSFGEITKPGVLDGYVKGIVRTAYPVFQTNFYGKMRKMILVETKDDDDDDDDECLEFPLFTRGTVAEKCAEIEEGDLLLLEKPFFERSPPHKTKFHIAGDKNSSDICVWIVNKKSKLLVGREEENGFEESDSELADNTTDSGNVENDMRDQNNDHDLPMDISGSDGEAPSPIREVRVQNVAGKSRKSPRIAKTDSSSESNEVPRSPRVKRSCVLKRNALSQPQRVTRSTSLRGNDASAKESSQESRNSFSTQTEKPVTRSTARKMTEHDVGPLPAKRKRRFHLGPKGASSSSDNSPELRNIVALEAKPKKTPRKENVPQTRSSKTTKVPSPQKSNNEIHGSSLKGSPRHQQQKVPSSSKSPKATISDVTDNETSQENGDDGVELQINSQASTPSGTFSSKKQKYFGQSDSTPGTPKNKALPKSKKAIKITPQRNKEHTDVVAGSSDEASKDTRNTNQPTNTDCAVITFVDDDKVMEKGSSSSDEQAKAAKHEAPKVQKSTKNADVKVNQPSTSTRTSSVPIDSATSSNVQTTSATTSSIQTTSATPSSVPTTSATPSSVQTTSATTSSTTTSATSSNVPTTSARSNTSPQSFSYSLPPTYTKISDVQSNTMCNLYGVAKFFKPPWKSKGTDMCSVVVLADPSSDEPLECVMFKDVVLLPQIRRVGDIVRLHRMNIKKYKDKLQAVSTKGFSALVFDGNINAPVTKEAARVTTGSFSFDETEKQVVQTLKQWRITRPDVFEEAKVLTVSMVEPDFYFDIVCQVKGISKHTNIDCIVLKVTDGTEPKYEIKSCEDDDSYQGVLAVDSHGQSPIFDIFLYGDHASLVMNLNVKVGTVLMLHNVHSIATQGGPGASLLDILEPTLELCIHRGSEYGRGLAVLSPDAEDVQKLLERLKKQAPISPKKQS